LAPGAAKFINDANGLRVWRVKPGRRSQSKP
jgi:hypothetical protein